MKGMKNEKHTRKPQQPNLKVSSSAGCFGLQLTATSRVNTQLRISLIYSSSNLVFLWFSLSNHDQKKKIPQLSNHSPSKALCNSSQQSISSTLQSSLKTPVFVFPCKPHSPLHCALLREDVILNYRHGEPCSLSHAHTAGSREAPLQKCKEKKEEQLPRALTTKGSTGLLWL